MPSLRRTVAYSRVARVVLGNDSVGVGRCGRSDATGGVLDLDLGWLSHLVFRPSRRRSRPGHVSGFGPCLQSGAEARRSSEREKGRLAHVRSEHHDAEQLGCCTEGLL